MLLLASHEAPDFIGLYVGNRNTANGRFQEVLAERSRIDHGVQQRVAVDSRDPFHSANAGAFQEHSEAEYADLGREMAPVERSGLCVGEGVPADIAAMALGTVAVEAEAPGRTLTELAFHKEPFPVGAGPW